MPDEPTLPPTPEQPSELSSTPTPAGASAQNDPLIDPLALPPEDPYEGAVPPGYDWPTHGGYLGCLCGVVASVIVFGLIGANLLSFFWASGTLSGPLFILLAVVLFFVLAYLFGRAGYVLGKRFYRAYPQQPGRTNWGEDESVRIEAGESADVLASERARLMNRMGSLGGGIVGGIVGVVISVKLFDALGILDMKLGTLEGLAMLVSFLVLAFVAILACVYFGAMIGRKLFARAEASVPSMPSATTGTTIGEATPAPRTSPPA